ncbi:MAG: DNRLRE domain-containing protein [Rhodothermales bacterium]|nr:DNRLRE domain-containing protein [Rhodothermales bacterium]
MSDQSSRSVTVGSETVVVQFQNGVAPSSAYGGGRDTKILSDQPNQNFGTAQNLEADGFPSYGILMAWDLATVPQNAGVQEASVDLTVTDVSGDTYGLFALNRPWSDAEATWEQASAGQPWVVSGAMGSDRDASPIGTFVPSRTGRISVSLNAAGLEAVQRWIVDPASNHGFVIDIVSGSDGVDLASMEAGALQRPALNVTYSTDPNATVTIPPVAAFTLNPENPVVAVGATFDASGSSDADGTITSYAWDFGDGGTGSGVQATHVYSNVGQYTARLTVTDNDGRQASAQRLVIVLGEQVEQIAFQDGVVPNASYSGTRDTKIKSDDENRAFGGDDNIEVDGSPDYGALLAWDISDVPAGATILSASIKLSVFDPTNDTYEVYALQRPWSESDATWREASNGVSWSQDGASGSGDAGSQVLGLLRNSGTGEATIALNESGLAVVQNWIDNPGSNYGFLIEDYARGNDGIDFHSREASNSAQRPRLELEYTLASTPSNRVSVTSDTGGTVSVQPALSAASDPLVVNMLPSLESLVSAPSVVDGGFASQDREYRISTERNTSVVLAVRTADSSRVDQGFSRERRLEIGSESWDLLRHTVARGGTGVDVPDGGVLFVAGGAPAATSTRTAGEQVPDQPGLDAYPNPFDETLKISYPEVGSGRVELADVLGRRIALIDLVDGEAEFDAEGLSPGTYFLRAVGEGVDGRAVAAKTVVVTKGR